MFVVNLKLKPTKLSLLSGAFHFSTQSIMNIERFRKWVYEDIIFVDPTKYNVSPYEDNLRQRFRLNGTKFNELFSVFNLIIKTDLEEKTSTEIDNKMRTQSLQLSARLTEKCEKIQVSFNLDTSFSNGIQFLFNDLFAIPDDWLQETEGGYPHKEMTLKEEMYIELTSKNVELVKYFYVITSKDTFLKTMNPSLYEKYSLLRN